MTLQPDLCQTCSQTTLLVFPRDGSIAVTTSISAPTSVITTKYSCYFYYRCNRQYKKVQVGNDQQMAQSENYSHFINRGVGKN